jgi:sulfur-oxidizing protein SoxB
MIKWPKISILQMNDLHGYMEPHPELYGPGVHALYRKAGGVARISTIFKKVREENPKGVIALDNGDTIHVTYIAIGHLCLYSTSLV